MKSSSGTELNETESSADSKSDRSDRFLLLATFVGGFAALAWQTIWQVRLSITLGVSAGAAAIVFSTMLIGMAIGSWAAGRFTLFSAGRNPARAYGLIELGVGVSSLAMMHFGFQAIEQIDGAIGRDMVQSVIPVTAILSMLLLAIPNILLGATAPILGQASAAFQIPLSRIYGMNIFGSVCGAIMTAFYILPRCGIMMTSWVNGTFGAAACIIAAGLMSDSNTGVKAQSKLNPAAVRSGPSGADLSFVTGFVIFALEVCWFRLLRAAFWSTSRTFAILVASALLALCLAAAAASHFRVTEHRRQLRYLALGSIFAIVATALFARTDLIVDQYAQHGNVIWFGWTFLVIIAPFFAYGIVFPSILDRASNQAEWARLYWINCIGGILGALISGWVLLPSIGAILSAYLIALVALAVAAIGLPAMEITVVAATATALIIFVCLPELRLSQSRVIGASSYGAHRVIRQHDGPEVSTSVVEFELPNYAPATDFWPALFIDGFAAAGNFGEHSRYMTWMGRLPAVLHPAPKSGLVICFGTGMTSNALRKEVSGSLDIVDVNPTVFQFSEYFPLNEHVLSDPRVTHIVMDGRIWLRRTSKTYDVITLEPMPPTFAGVNSLYSLEFYKLIREHLAPGGVTAQWLPAHLVSDFHTRSIAKTFQQVFPRAIVWSESDDGQAILIGFRDDEPSGSQLEWHRLEDPRTLYPLPASEVIHDVRFDADKLKQFAQSGEIVTDDNQLLSFGPGLEVRFQGARNVDFLAKKKIRD